MKFVQFITVLNLDKDFAIVCLHTGYNTQIHAVSRLSRWRTKHKLSSSRGQPNSLPSSGSVCVQPSQQTFGNNITCCALSNSSLSQTHRLRRSSLSISIRQRHVHVRAISRRHINNRTLRNGHTRAVLYKVLHLPRVVINPCRVVVGAINLGKNLPSSSTNNNTRTCSTCRTCRACCASCALNALNTLWACITSYTLDTLWACCARCARCTRCTRCTSCALRNGEIEYGCRTRTTVCYRSGRPSSASGCCACRDCCC